MSKELLFWLLLLVVLSIFLNQFYWKQLTYIQQTNVSLSTINNQITPSKFILNENYTTTCINDTITENNLKGYTNTIIYYLNNPVSFSCDTDFYNWNDWLNNLIELENNINKVCVIEDTTNSNESYFCSSK